MPNGHDPIHETDKEVMLRVLREREEWTKLYWEEHGRCQKLEQEVEVLKKAIKLLKAVD